jgi:hypothetical protein
VIGWATEYARDKFSVGCDDTDLTRLCLELVIEKDWLTSYQAFQLLELECERCVIVMSTKYVSSNQQEQFAKNRAQLEALVNAIRAEQKAREPGWQPS